MEPKLEDNSITNEHHRIRKELVLSNMHIKMVQKQVKFKELVNQLTRLNSKYNNDLGADSLGICTFFVLDNLENYDVKANKE